VPLHVPCRRAALVLQWSGGGDKWRPCRPTSAREKDARSSQNRREDTPEEPSW